jgi:hypothetical protein
LDGDDLPRTRTFRPRRLIALLAVFAVAGVLAVDASAVAATPAHPAKSVLSASFKPHKGDYIVNYSGSGAGSFSFSWPPNNEDCNDGESYSMSYTYHWHWQDDTYGLGGGGAIWSKWVAGGHTSSTTSYTAATGPGCDSPIPTGGTCSANYLTPNGNDSGLWPEVYTNGASHKRIAVGYSDGGLQDPTSLFNGSCAYEDSSAYNGNDDGFPETGSITAHADWLLATAKKGKVLSATQSRTTNESCSGVTDCGAATDGGNQSGPMTFGEECGSGDVSYLGIDQPGESVTCTEHDHYSGKLTVQYVKK